MISMVQYWMDRDRVYASECTAEIKQNAALTVAAINKVLSAFAAATGIVLTRCASGWRPACVNCLTSNAADHSLHITADAGDIEDTSARDLARWVAANQKVLVEAGLYCERFEWTSKKNPATGKLVSWVHFQRLPPRSGKRFYIPSTAPALAARLPEQDKFNC